MRKLTGAFELRNLFRNVYFWMAFGALVLLLYAGFIAFFLPRSTSEVTGEEAEKTEETATDKKTVADKKNETKEKPQKNVSVKGTGALSNAKFRLITNGGWFDSDDHKMTIVMQVFNLSSTVVDEIIKSGSVEIEIDGVAATIINSEPYKGNGFLTRAEAVLSDDKFEKFIDGKTQSVKITTTVNHGDEKSAKDVTNKRFTKTKTTEVEGVKIDWK